MSEARDRIHAARRSGGRQLDSARWKALVAKAIEIEDAERPDFLSESPVPMRTRHPYVVCGRRQLPIDARTVLDIELTLGTLSLLQAELEDMGAREQLDEGYRASLVRTIATAVQTIERRLRDDQRTHLKVVTP